MTDKFQQWLKSQDRIPVDAPPGHRCCEEAAREGWEACKIEIVKAIEKKFINRYRIISLDTVLDYIDKEF